MAPRLGTGGHSVGKCPARAAIRWAPGLGHRTLFKNQCPRGLSRQQGLAGTWALPQGAGMFLEHCLCACALVSLRLCEPQVQCLLSLFASLSSSVKWAQPQHLLLRLLIREKVVMHAVMCLQQQLAHRKHFINWRRGLTTITTVSVVVVSQLLCID